MNELLHESHTKLMEQFLVKILIKISKEPGESTAELLVGFRKKVPWKPQDFWGNSPEQFPERLAEGFPKKNIPITNYLRKSNPEGLLLEVSNKELIENYKGAFEGFSPRISWMISRSNFSERTPGRLLEWTPKGLQKETSQEDFQKTLLELGVLENF